jgi:Domain of unknown function (DUF1707)
MPASSSPRFSRGFGPLLGGYPDQNMRVSDAERQAVADRLAVHYGDGRLDQAELDDRVSRAMSAKTRADLSGLLDDLPESGPARASGIPDRSGHAGQIRPHRHGHGVLVLAAIIVIAVAAAHTVAWFALSWLWIGAVAVIALVATGHIGHHHEP